MILSPQWVRRSGIVDHQSLRVEIRFPNSRALALGPAFTDKHPRQEYKHAQR